MNRLGLGCTPNRRLIERRLPSSIGNPADFHRDGRPYLDAQWTCISCNGKLGDEGLFALVENDPESVLQDVEERLCGANLVEVSCADSWNEFFWNE